MFTAELLSEYMFKADLLSEYMFKLRLLSEYMFKAGLHGKIYAQGRATCLNICLR